MNTRILDIQSLDDAGRTAIAEAAAVLRRGGLVAFPTETVYGLGANALDPAAVEAIFAAKGRPADNPLIVHIADPTALTEIAREVPEEARALAVAFWPGPLTLVLPRHPRIPLVTTGGLDTVAVRMPDDPVALALIEAAGCPVAAPSANRSGRPSPTRAAHVAEDLDGRVDVILRAGDCRVGIESTVLDLTGPVPMVLRPGIVTPEEIAEVLGVPVELDPALCQTPGPGTPGPGTLESGTQVEEEATAPAPKAPGMKYAHYAPRAEMLILRGQEDAIRARMDEIRREREAMGQRVGTILFGAADYREAARDFFARLRELDGQEVDLILAGALDEGHSLGVAVMNRMLKSAGYHVIDL